MNNKLAGLAAGSLLFLLAAPSAGQELLPSGSSALAEMEIGGDQHERRYFLPHLRFSFPVRSSSFFADILYYQRINSRLQGEVDFWLRTGLFLPASPDISIEASLNHMSRHKTSISYPNILDVNEVLLRAWFERPGFRWGLGTGGYLRGEIAFSTLVVANASLQNILGSEFSLAAELKFAEFRELFYEVEFSAALNGMFSLFLRATRHYGYRPTTYLGLRLKSGEKDSPILQHLRFRGNVLPSDDTYKLFALMDVKLELSRKPERRLLLAVESFIPVFRADSFIGPFPPEWIRYPLALEYEKTVSPGLRGYLTCTYDIIMPLDAEDEFKARLGLGLGLRNQAHFDLLLQPLRFELAGVLNFDRTTDVRLKLGANTTGWPTDLGADMVVKAAPDSLIARGRLFAEFSGATKVRPFIGLETIVPFESSSRTVTRWWVGVELIRWAGAVDFIPR